MAKDKIEQWAEEFMWRGRPPSGPGSEDPPAYHVVIGMQAPDQFDVAKVTRRMSEPLTPEQAEALGWPLERVLEGINAEMAKSLDAVKAQLAEAQGNGTSLSAELEQAKAALDEANAMCARLDAARQEAETKASENAHAQEQLVVANQRIGEMSSVFAKFNELSAAAPGPAGL